MEDITQYDFLPFEHIAYAELSTMTRAMKIKR